MIKKHRNLKSGELMASDKGILFFGGPEPALTDLSKKMMLVTD